MNFEQLCLTVIRRWQEIPNKKKAVKLLRYFQEQLALKKKKLKLGSVTFDIKQIVFYQIVLWEEIEIRYTRQDTSEEDERKVENILKRLGWKWDAKNILAFCVVLFGIVTYLYSLLRYQYQKYLPAIAFRSEHHDYVLRYGFENCFSPYAVGTFRQLSSVNYWMVDLLTDFCTYFNVIF